MKTIVAAAEPERYQKVAGALRRPVVQFAALAKRLLISRLESLL